MSFTITVDVFCDECGDWIYGYTSGSKVGKKEAEEVAVSRGWVKIRKNVHICPVCAQKRMRHNLFLA